jgi:methylenetetrahydrofolate reductase (NADPH)
VQVPAELSRRLRGVPEDRLADEAMTACAETISDLRQIPGVAGVHVMAVANEHRIPAILRLAGLSKGRGLAGLSEVGGEAGTAATAGRRSARADGTRGGLGGSSPRGDTDAG